MYKKGELRKIKWVFSNAEDCQCWVKGKPKIHAMILMILIQEKGKQLTMFPIRNSMSDCCSPACWRLVVAFLDLHIQIQIQLSTVTQMRKYQEKKKGRFDVNQSKIYKLSTMKLFHEYIVSEDSHDDRQ